MGIQLEVMEQMRAEGAMCHHIRAVSSPLTEPLDARPDIIASTVVRSGISPTYKKALFIAS